MKLHLARLKDKRYAVCDDRGERCIYVRARGFQAAARKWIDKFGEQPESMSSYRDGPMRIAEWAMTMLDLKESAKKEAPNAGTARGG